MKRVIALVVAATLIAGCAPQKYNLGSGKTQQSFVYDKDVCLKEADIEGGGGFLFGPLIIILPIAIILYAVKVNKTKTFEKCMTDKGYVCVEGCYNVETTQSKTDEINQNYVPTSTKKDQAEAMRILVTKASNYLALNSKKEAFSQINDPSGIFINENLFIFVIDTKQNGMIVASADKTLLKRNNNTQDETGKLFIKAINEIAISDKNGYMFYMWNNQEKSCYFQKVNNLIVVGSD